jgi:hypothetical protein
LNVAWPFAVSQSRARGFCDIITPADAVGHTGLDILDRMGILDDHPWEHPKSTRLSLPKGGRVTVVVRSTPAVYTGPAGDKAPTPVADPNRGSIPLIEGVVITGPPLGEEQLHKIEDSLLAQVRPQAQRSFNRLWDAGADEDFTSDRAKQIPLVTENPSPHPPYPASPPSPATSLERIRGLLVWPSLRYLLIAFAVVIGAIIVIKARDQS